MPGGLRWAVLIVVGVFASATSVAKTTCPMVVALEALMSDARVAPPSPESVRQALNRLKVGQPADRAIAMLRRDLWEPGIPLPPMARRLGGYSGTYHPLRRKPLRLFLPPPLLGTPIELAVAVHEHQHGRIHRIFPELVEFQRQLVTPVGEDPFHPDAEAITEHRATLMYWQEQIAMRGEAAVFRALDDGERRATLERLARVSDAMMAPESRAYLTAAIEAGPVDDATYLRIQHAHGRYGLDTLCAQWRAMLEHGRSLRRLRELVGRR